MPLASLSSALRRHFVAAFALAACISLPAQAKDPALILPVGTFNPMQILPAPGTR